jgi:nicotinamidase-related amidase
VVVIDLQQEFLSATGYLARSGYDPSPLRAILPTVNRLIEAARSAGMSIIFTRQGHRADMADMTPYEKWRRARAGLEGTDILLRSGPGFQIVREIDVASSDIIVDKTCNGAFTTPISSTYCDHRELRIFSSAAAPRTFASTPPSGRPAIATSSA